VGQTPKPQVARVGTIESHLRGDAIRIFREWAARLATSRGRHSMRGWGCVDRDPRDRAILISSESRGSQGGKADYPAFSSGKMALRF
jgi:hypothetical protein